MESSIGPIMSAAKNQSDNHRASLDGIDTVIVATPDLAGRLVGKRVTARSYRGSGDTNTCDVIFGWGVGHELLDGFEDVGWNHGYGDVVTKADPATLRTIAWWPRTALVMADAIRGDGEPVAFAPRQILRRQLLRAQSLGFEPLVASELEFTLFAETPASLEAKGYAKLALQRHELHPELVETTGSEEELLAEIRQAMEASGILIESVKGEYSPSQFEIAFDPGSALEICDRHAVYKLGVREICRRHGMSATFMAKWHEERGGQSCHLHVSLEDDEGRNVFAEGNDVLIRQFIAGLQRYGRELFLLWAPYPNSYKRFRPSTFAPHSLSWGTDNRTAGLRILGKGAGRHLENRVPGGDVNPYLAHAGLLAAGLAGIEEGLEPDKGVGHANAYGSHEVPPIPVNPEEAIRAFADSEFTAATFGSDVVHHIANFAQSELNASRLSVTDWDRRRLFDI